jgi:hypothetical protein
MIEEVGQALLGTCPKPFKSIMGAVHASAKGVGTSIQEHHAGQERPGRPRTQCLY